MGANPTIYCLENLTDYHEFERLCTDLMALEGYPSIEPLGGFSDKGRDAIHVNKADRTTIFAYSVRENWRVKLSEDASKILRHGHQCNELVFMTTSPFSATERDEAVAYILQEYGWELQIFGLERLRVLLEVTHPEIRQNHPQIFNPALFTSWVGTLDRNRLFLSYVEQDWGLADWLTRKLTAEGYAVWCERFTLLGGEHYPDDVDDAINNRAFRIIALYSNSSVKNQEVMRQRLLGLMLGKQRQIDFLIPINVDGLDISHLDKETGTLVFIPFYNSWTTGYNQLLKKLETIQCPKPIFNGNRVAASDYLGPDLVTDQAEPLFANFYLVDKLPKYIYVFEAKMPIPYEDKWNVGVLWAYRKVGSRFYLGFHEPSQDILQKYGITEIDSIEWKGHETVNKIDTRHLLSELVRKSLDVRCYQKGLQFCSASEFLYFPSGLVPNDNLKLTRPDGYKTWVSSVGQRTYWTLEGSEVYNYAIAPVFHVVQDVFDELAVQIEIRVRLTDENGKLLARRKINSRRKHLCQNWWNTEWFNRQLAVIQFLADGDKIIIGSDEDNSLIINASPLCLSSTAGIDEQALQQITEKRKKVREELGISADTDSEEVELSDEEYDE